MIIGILKTAARAASAQSSRFKLACMLVGGASAVFLWAWHTQLTGLLGSSPAVATAILLAAATGLVIGFRLSTGSSRDPKLWLVSGVLLFTAATWAWGFPFLVQRIGGTAQQWGPSLIHSPATAFGFTFCAALIAIGIPAVALAKTWSILTHFAETQIASDSGENHTAPTSAPGVFSRVPLVWLTVGFAGGLVLAGSGLGPWLGVQATALTAAVIAGLAGFYCMWQSAQPGIFPTSAAAVDAAETSARRKIAIHAATWVAVAVFGLFVANTIRMTGQLFQISAELRTLTWAGLALGLSLGVAWGSWRMRRGSDPARAWAPACMACAAWIVVLTAAFPWLIRASLWLNAYESSRFWLMAGRTGIVWLFVLPAGVAWGLAMTAFARSQSPRPTATMRQFGLIPAAVGYCLYRLCDLAAWGPAVVMTAVAIGLWLAAGIAGISNGHLLRGWWRRGLAGASLAAVIASPLWQHHYNPAVTARTLFSTDIFVAYRSKFDLDELSHYDDARLYETVEGDRGTFTVWKRRGSQWQVRENGLSHTVVATDPLTHPQYSAELMPGLVPLVLHEEPRRALFLGIGGGVALTGSLHFPLTEIACVEAERTYLNIIKNDVFASAHENPFEDDRVHVAHADPALVAVAGREMFDVIVSEPGYSSREDTAAHFTAEFYQNFSEQLTEDGIFAQRFRYFDYGPEPLRIAANTLRQAFEHVMLLQTAPGEMLLLGTNSPNGLVRPGLLDRAGRPHVQAALANLGWDWSIVLNLSAHGGDNLDALLKDAPVAVNTVANGRFACSLPREVIRWGNKMQEVAVALVPRTGRLIDGMGDEATDPALLEHLEEVTGQHRLIQDYPDQYWAYRASVRDRVTSGASERSIIQQVKHQLAEQDFHPRDERRMEYFEALGKAQASKSPEDIERVAAFATPYDPMISYFLHGEIAELYSRAGENRDVAAELRHRLHTTYYTVAGDRSVRNILEALELLIKEPEAAENPLARWDHMNGLLQMLQTNWYARGSAQPKSFRVVLNDISASLKTIDRSFHTMRELTTTAGLEPSAWNEREKVLQRTLVKPLHDYRATLKPQYEKAKATGQLIKDRVENPAGQ